LALKATVYRAGIQVSDIDRGYYDTRTLTLARHPSETEERLMLRVLAFVMHAAPELDFGRGLSTDDEPDLWLRDDAGEIRLWIDVGLPDERRLRRAAGRSRAVALVTYGERATDVWWRKHEAVLARLKSLSVWSVSDEDCAGLASLAARSMSLQATLQDGQISLTDSRRYLVIEPARLQ
jgi:uncharacterized protein YaeQ